MMCTFRKMSKSEIKVSSSYIIATTILNQPHEFRIDDILDAVKIKMKDASDEKDKSLKKAINTKLKMMRNNGLLVHHGSYYTLRKHFDMAIVM